MSQNAYILILITFGRDGSTIPSTLSSSFFVPVVTDRERRELSETIDRICFDRTSLDVPRMNFARDPLSESAGYPTRSGLNIDGVFHRQLYGPYVYGPFAYLRITFMPRDGDAEATPTSASPTSRHHEKSSLPPRPGVPK